MKKFISIVAAIAMSAVMATSAFAASNDVANLKALASDAASRAGVDASTFNAFIDDYAEEHADMITSDVVNQLVAIKETVQNTPVAERNNDFILAQSAKAIDALKAAGITVTVNNMAINGGVVSVSATLSAPDAASVSSSITVAGKVNGNTSTTGATASATTVTSSGVIKNTGVDATSAVVLAVAVAGVLGGAVVGVRKMNLLAQ